MGLEDPEVLQWAANENRILLTHDVTTMTKHAIDRISEGKLFSGMIEVKQRAAIGQAIDDIELLVKCGSEEDWTGQITYIPLT